MSGCSHTTYSRLFPTELPLLFCQRLTIFVCLFLDFLFCSTDLSVPSPIPYCLHYKQYTQEVKFNGESVFCFFSPPKVFNKYFGVKKNFFLISTNLLTEETESLRGNVRNQFPFVVLSINCIKGLKS